MTSINRLNSDCFNHIMSYLPVGDVPVCRRVCSLWRKRLDAEQFSNRFFTQKLHSFITLDTIVNCFKKQIRTFQVLSFENCQELKDDNLTAIAAYVKIRDMRFRDNPHITEKGICALVPRLLSPARLTIRDGCPNVGLASVIDALRASNIQMQELNFKNFMAPRNLMQHGLSDIREPPETEVEKALVVFIEQALLVSPCSLNFKRMQKFNSNLLFAALVKLNVVVASLNLGYTSSAVPMPASLRTTSPVVLRIPNELENNSMIEANRIFTSFGKFEAMSPEFLETVALEHLCDKDCSVELHNKHTGSITLAKKLATKQIKKLCLPYPAGAIDIKGINLLLSQGNFQKIKFGPGSLFGQSFLNDQYLTSLISNPNRPTSMTIVAKCFPWQFEQIFGEKRLADLPMRFTYRSELITQKYVDIIAQSGVKFERFKINSSIPLSIEPLISAKLLENCRTLELPGGNFPKMLESSSSLKIKKLTLRYLKDFESVKSIFADRKKFQNLTELRFDIRNVNAGEVYAFLKEVRPNLAIQFI